MTGFLIGLAIAWIVITLVGHASWLVIAKLGSLLTGSADSSENTVAQKHTVIAKKVLRDLHGQGRINSETMERVVYAINQQESLGSREQTSLKESAQNPNPTHIATTQSNRSHTNYTDGDSQDRSRAAETPQSAIIVADLIQENEAEPPIAAPVAHSLHHPETPPQSSPRLSDAKQALRHGIDEEAPDYHASRNSDSVPYTKAPRPRPSVSLAEIIQSFLMAHNIRWGELIAGTMIVVCSIGLVISLWGPLVQTHRAIPTLIFLAANAAIYGVGLYTLSRWRLRHTSRAVLVIATLLIPLSVLAGIAASGIDTASAINLTDPITLGTIGLAALVYSLFLYKGGSALTSRTHVWPIFLAVAGPLLALVLSPTAIRTFEEQAGWVISIGSFSVVLASIMIGRLNRRRIRTLGSAAARHHLLVMGFSFYSLTITTLFIGYHLRSIGSSALMPLAMACIPACIALAGIANFLRERARNSVVSMIAAVCCVLLSAITLVVVAPAMSSPIWLWTWAVLIATSLVAGHYILQQPTWLALATLPVGFVAICTAQNWMGSQVWQAKSLLMRFLNGEAMLASLLMCLISSILWHAVKSKASKQWLKYAGMGWLSATLLITTGLSLAPEPDMGIVPIWIVTITLFTAMVAIFLISLRDDRASYFTVIASAFSFNSIFHVVPSLSQETAVDCIYLALSVSCSLTFLSELACRFATRQGRSSDANGKTVQKQLASASLVIIGIAVLLTVVTARERFELCCLTFLTATIIAVWLAGLLIDLNLFKLAQIPTFLLTVALTLEYFEANLWTQASWLSGQAAWGWAVALGVLAISWYLLREAATFFVKRNITGGKPEEQQNKHGQNTSIVSRVSGLFGQKIHPFEMPDTWFGIAAVALNTAATIYFFCNINQATVSQAVLDYEISWLVSATAWVTAGAFLVLLTRQKTQREISYPLSGLLGVFFTLWFSCQISAWMITDPKIILITSVSLATVLYFAAKPVLRSINADDGTSNVLKTCNATQCVILFTGSMSLLYSGVYLPIKETGLADFAAATSITVWWFIVSMLALWETKRQSSVWSLVLSAFFFAAAGTVLTTPFFDLPLMSKLYIACLLTFVWLAIASHVLPVQSTIPSGNGHTHQLQIILGLLVTVGVITSIGASLNVILGLPAFESFLSPTGAMLSLVAAAAMVSSRARHVFTGETASNWYLSLPCALSLLAGQITWILQQSYFTMVSPGTMQSVEIMMILWTLAAVMSSLLPGNRQRVLDFYHLAAVALAALIAAIYYQNRSDILPYLSLLTTVIVGTQITLMSAGKRVLDVPPIASRILGWFVGLSGVALSWQVFGLQITYITLWITAWVLIWRYVDREKATRRFETERLQHLPLLEFGLFLCITALVDLAYSLSLAADSYFLNDPMLWLRSTCYTLAAGSVVIRARTSMDWFISLAMLGTSFSLFVVALTKTLGGAQVDQYTAALTSCTIFFAASTSLLGSLAKLTARMTSSSPESHFLRLVTASKLILALLAVVSVASPIAMVLGRLPLPQVQIAIVSVAIVAWAFAEISDQASIAKLRYVAVTLGLVAIAMWATATSLDTEYLLLTISMRWIVASFIMMPTLVIILPKVLGPVIRERWQDALLKGAFTSGVACGISIFVMLTLEFTLRDKSGLAALPLILVIGVASTLAASSLMCGLAALATGPRSRWRLTIPITDPQRAYLLIATQLLGFLTWLHVFLCKPEWALLGLRDHWPYLVMGLSFISVGITEFARRRGDKVMSDTIRKTALYLPLIPLLGLWLSVSNQADSVLWNLIEMDFEILLVVLAIYYLVVGTMWKATMPRVMGVILGNVAWWFLLVQAPGWGFMMHPQLWLIPPAACVLVMTHFYRHRLDPQLVSGIRYASTLLIYISSSADMLLQQMGTTLAGPVVLILLALAGMLLGVALRIRPFLYLGATFVFMGVTSMVWHAHRAFESTWPWWVFGISMGLLLLAGLMTLEKFKPQLQAYSKQLSQWEQ